MPTVELKPNWWDDGWKTGEFPTVTGNPSIYLDELTDGSDASGISGPRYMWCYVYVPGAGAQSGKLASIGARLRSRASAAGAIWSPVIAGKVDDYRTVNVDLPALAVPLAYADLVTPAASGADPAAFAGVPDPLTDHLGIEVDLNTAPDGVTVYLSELSVMLYYLAPATCGAPTVPTSPVSDTQYPTLSVPLSVLVESWQLAGTTPFLCGGDVELRVFASADAPGSTPPDGVTAVWSGTTRFSATTVGAQTPTVSLKVGSALGNGDYVVFARASRDLRSGTQQYWSGWVKSTAWTQEIALPADPSLALSVDDAAQAVTADVVGTASSGYDAATAAYDVQRQAADGSWVDVRGGMGVAGEAGAHTLVEDAEAVRGVANTYRARCSMVFTESGVRMYSHWAGGTVTGPAVRGWNLKPTDDPEGSWIDAPVVTEPTEESQTSVGLFEVLDRDLPVVVVGTVAGMGGGFDLSAVGADQIELLGTLRDYAGVVLLETAFGDAKYIRLTKIGWVRRGTAASPRRYATVTYAEVGPDLGNTAS